MKQLRFFSGTWHRPSEPYDANKVHDDIKYSEEDDKAIDNWIAGSCPLSLYALLTENDR